jgi:hypothetical protein
MKKNHQLSVIKAIICMLPFFGFSGCAGNGSAVKSESPPRNELSASQDFSSSYFTQVDWDRVIENTWQLVSVEKDRMINRVDRKKLEANGMNDTYTLRFSGNYLERRVYGKGAPNNFTAMFGMGDHSTISISHILSTKMATIYEPAELKEHEYFRYLERAGRWSMDYAEHLKLFTTDEDGEDVYLIFRKIQ